LHKIIQNLAYSYDNNEVACKHRFKLVLPLALG
jgi:transcriptional antiterminator Rof (Rho-off)